MAAFFHYFSSGLVASMEQVAQRIDNYVAPFDEELRSQIGIGASEAVDICRFVANRLQGNLDSLSAAALGEKPWAEKALEVLDGLERLGLITLAELEEAFPTTAHSYWKQFTVSRGEGPEIQYPTEPSVFDTQPLIRIDGGTAFCVAANTLFSAVLKTAEETLFRGPLRDKYLQARDKALEREVARYARTLFGQHATIWKRVYETVGSQHEHDVIAFDEHLCIVFEAKASPPPEPFRDPERAFARIRDGFRAVIQTAYGQGNRIVSRLRKQEVVRLFDEAGHEVGELLPSTRFVACACVTRDDFGALATNLSLLLEKSPEDAYPWAVNITDLSTLAEAWAYFNWGSSQLRDYLEQRLKLHGAVFGGYELEYAGGFINHGGFVELKSTNTIVQLNPGYSNVFDDIYRHIYHGGPPVSISRKEPVLTDLRQSLALGQPVFVETTHKRAKVGRNERCPCGSGRKYKKCCGK